MRRSLLALLTLLLPVSAACGQTTGTAHHSTGNAAVVQSQTESGYQAAAVKPWYRSGMHGEGFQSPTGNIRCALKLNDSTTLLCETLNEGQNVVLHPTGLMQTNWTVTIPAGNPTLKYGKNWWGHDFWCDSEAQGTFCRSLYSRHGFLINRAGTPITSGRPCRCTSQTPAVATADRADLGTRRSTPSFAKTARSTRRTTC